MSADAKSPHTGKDRGRAGRCGHAASSRTPDLESMRAELMATRTELQATRAELESRTAVLQQAWEELEISRDRFRDLYHLTPGGCLTLDREGRILEANLAAATLLERKREALLRSRFERFVPPASAEAFKGFLDGCLERRGVATAELRLKRAGGEEFQALLHGTALARDRTRSTCQVTVTDDSERWKAGEALRASEERYRELADSVSDPFYSVDERLRCTYLNPAAARLLGLDAEAAIGKPVKALIEEPGIAARVAPILLRTLHTGEPGTFVTPWPGQEGPTFLEVRVYRSRRGLSVFARDISARMALDAERERMIVDLAAMREQAERRAAEAEQGRERLAETMEDLERSNEELDRFAVVAAHDLSEPLRSMSGYAQLIRARHGQGLDAKSDEYLVHIAASAARMQALLEDLLSYARIGRRERPFADADLNRALEAALENLSTLVEETAPAITRERLPTVRADEGQMVELLQNLLANAMKFRRGPNPRIVIAAERRESEDVVSVGDDGVGIDPRHFEVIFQIFRRLHGGTGPAGTGVGLAICKKIVERHRGRIWVESEPGRGSTFFFALPRAN